jgi:hypothetical protein
MATCDEFSGTVYVCSTKSKQKPAFLRCPRTLAAPTGSGSEGGTLVARKDKPPGTIVPTDGTRLSLLIDNESGGAGDKPDRSDGMESIGTRLLLYTNESVNIWEFHLEPRSRCSYHRHHLPYFYTDLTESLTQELTQQDEIAAPPRLQKMNQTRFVRPELLGEHAVINVGDGPFLQFVVELKVSIPTTLNMFEQSANIQRTVISSIVPGRRPAPIYHSPTNSSKIER